MNDKTVTLLAFALGATIGSIVTWRYLKNTYEQIAQEEIDSVKEVFLKRENQSEEAGKKVTKIDNKHECSVYESILQNEGYINYSDMTPEKEETEMLSDKPYVISPEEFGEFDEYEKISLTYYSNNILADENDEAIEDVEEMVGFDSLNHFGEYEDDSVFVRNDARKCDYEILLDQRSYSEVVQQMPHYVEE